MSRGSTMRSPGAGRTPATTLNVEFDGRQLIIRSDVARVLDFARSTYVEMLVPKATASVGTIEIVQRKNGFAIRGFESIDIADVFGGEVDVLLPVVKQEVFYRFVRARPDLFWLHAGVAERDGSALVLPGVSGQGKSTLVTLLCERGWRLMSDDVAPIFMDSNVVLPFLQIPMRRIYPGRRVPAGEIEQLGRETVAIPRESVWREPAAIRAVVFPRFEDPECAELSLLSPGDAALELLRHCSNFVDHRGDAVERAASMARSVPFHRLSYHVPLDAAAILDAIH